VLFGMVPVVSSQFPVDSPSYPLSLPAFHRTKSPQSSPDSLRHPSTAQLDSFVLSIFLKVVLKSESNCADLRSQTAIIGRAVYSKLVKCVGLYSSYS
jgi:hypothetical protein